MKPYYSDEWLTILEGDCRAVLPLLPADSVDCVVTSPPYWNLRDYGTASWVGGDEACDHLQPLEATAGGRVGDNGRDRKASGGTFHGGPPSQKLHAYRDACGKCGATRQDSQLGLERTPEEYVANLVAVFAEVRRVLKPSGTCWLNLGDSYNTAGTRQGNGKGGIHGDGLGTVHRAGYRGEIPGLKPKDLVGIPWRVAFALQADGWYLRSDVIWSKPNPMPESVTDRPTKSHEYLFLLTKSARYYFDADAVRESYALTSHTAEAEMRGEYARGQFGMRSGAKGSALAEGAADGRQTGVSSFKNGGYTQGGRNIRSVWTIATRPYPGAHFAVFPPELPERCIKAGSSEKGVCPECGAPWERVVERKGDGRLFSRDQPEGASSARRNDGSRLTSGTGHRTLNGTTPSYRPPEVTTNGWEPTCTCGATTDGSQTLPVQRLPGTASGGDRGAAGDLPELPARLGAPSPAVILDPFAGSGTVGLVANRLSRRAILIDLNPEYLRQQMTRNAQTPLGLGAA